MTIIRFDKEKTEFDQNLIKIHNLELIKSLEFTFRKIKLSYNNKKIKIRLPLNNLNGIYYNKDLKTHTLTYPRINENTNIEVDYFLNWMRNFEHFVQGQLKAYNVQDIFSKTENGENMYIKFYSKDSQLQHLCFDLKGNKQDINKVASYGNTGKYIVIIDIPAVYIADDKEHTSKFQIYGNTVFASTSYTANFNIVDILNKDREIEEESDNEN